MDDTIPRKVVSLAGFTRRRKALVAAFLPYLLLSVFVDFVHLHRLITGPAAASSASLHVQDASGASSKLPDTSCAICQWVRAGSGAHPTATAHGAPVLVASAVVARSTLPPSRPDLGSADFRGPPRSLSL
jgi:hypothetical protein